MADIENNISSINLNKTSNKVSITDDSYDRCCGIIFILIFTIMPIIELVFASKYKHKSTCNSFMTEIHWLTIDGSVGVTLSFFACLMVLFLDTNKTNSIYAFLKMFGFICGCFNFAWTIVGTVLLS